MVCLSSRGPNSERLLRYASRLAGKLNRNWYAVYVQTPSEEARAIDARTQRLLSDTLTLAKQLGAMVFTYKGEDIVDTLLRFAAEYRVGHIVVGRSVPKPFWKRLRGSRPVVADLLKKARGVVVTVLDTRRETASSTRPPQVERAGGETSSAGRRALIKPTAGGRSDRHLGRTRPEGDSPQDAGVDLWEGGRDRRLESPFLGYLEREEQGSTFFNEGVAFPHVRVPGLSGPAIALGLTRKGVPDVITEKRMEIVFLILSPEEEPNTQVELLAQAGRAARNRCPAQKPRLLQDGGRGPRRAPGFGNGPGDLRLLIRSRRQAPVFK